MDSLRAYLFLAASIGPNAEGQNCTALWFTKKMRERKKEGKDRGGKGEGRK
jgi:hypothetical protein